MSIKSVNIKSALYGLLVVLVTANMPGIAFAQEKTGSTAARESKPSADAAGQTGNGLIGAAAKNSNGPSAEKKAAPGTTKGETLRGKVVYVTDGDTLTLLVDKKEYKIRLLGINAPEDDQPFGKQAAKAMSDMVLHKTVQVSTFGQDIYGNTLGIVNLDGKNINLELVKQGSAWHYKAYLDSKTLTGAEDEARKAKIGLWAEENPIPPWQWRQQTGIGNSEDPFNPKADNPNGSGTAKSPADQGQKYWLTASSNVRHNSKCRYYQKTKGRPCGPNEGTPCKICGG